MTANDVAHLIGTRESQVLRWEGGGNIHGDYRQKLYQHGLLPLAAVTGLPKDNNTYYQPPAGETA